MKNFQKCNDDLQEIPSFTIKEISDCMSATANAIAIGIKQNASINDVEAYINRWCDCNYIPDDLRRHMSNVVSATLHSLGYER
jgi:hypothetical protein